VEREGQIVQDETVWTRPDGREVDVLESARVVRDNSGAVRYYEGVVEDITERKRAEQELRAEKHFIDSALNSLPGAFYLIDQDLRYRRWNRQLESVTGYDSDELAEANPLQFIVAADRERVANRIRRAFEEGHAAVEARIRTRGGEAIPLYLTAARVRIEGELYLVGMGIDISERVAAEEALREAKQEAEEMNRLKSVFLANMSHEIRTPLTSILGFADVLAEETDGEAQRVAERVQQSGHRLKETLTSVLELARLERESAEVDAERCDLAERVQDTLDLMRPQVESNGLDLQVRMPSGPVPLRADPRVLHRVLTNLVSNAIKFTEEGRVRVAVERAADEAVLVVSDTGIGISDEFLDRVFDEFRQESEGLTRAHEGSGLGLTITQRLVELMDGAIEAESTKGEGSTFTVRLPLDASSEAAAEAAADRA
jgi:PAS domain S-box-containing protein